MSTEEGRHNTLLQFSSPGAQEREEYTGVSALKSHFNGNSSHIYQTLKWLLGKRIVHYFWYFLSQKTTYKKESYLFLVIGVALFKHVRIFVLKIIS